MSLLHLAMVLACAALISAQIAVNKKCPTIKTQSDFQVDKYVHLWYEIKKIPNAFQLAGKCDTARYNKLENGTVEVINRMCLYDNEVNIIGNARGESVDAIKAGKFKVRFPVMGNHDSPYHVLGTDYDNYAVVWSCTEAGTDTSLRFLWVLGKSSTLSDEHKKAVDKIINDAGLTEEFGKLKDTEHKDCCYDPTKYGNSAGSVGFSVALLLSTIMVRFL